MDTIRKKSTINWPEEFDDLYLTIAGGVPDMGIMDEGGVYSSDGMFIFPDGSTWNEKDGTKTFEEFRKEKIKEHGMV